MAASSTVIFIFALLAEERSYLSSSISVNTITVVCDRRVRKKKNSVLQIYFKLPSTGFIHKTGFSFLELRKQNNDFTKFQSIIIQQSIYYRK